jgi:3-deoxy-manno-octulosonate cytidylyltransferase (CMP-KDO synthetase)
MRVLGVIPARLGSTRLPHKPLQLLAGAPLVTRVFARVRQHGLVDTLVVATDSERVAEVVRATGGRAVLTDPAHPSGTDRVAEVAAAPEFRGHDVVVNIQGDEPFLAREALAGALGRVADGDPIGTVAAPLAADEADEPSRVKVVTDARGRALYFSRAPIPAWRGEGPLPARLYWQHLGVYAYTPAALARWAALAPTALEQAERLEQLRPLAHGMTIGVARLEWPALPGVDTPDDLRLAEARWPREEEAR